jgi:hypothetical protein
MTTINATHSYVKDHPIRFGLFVVLGILMVSSMTALAFGFGSPTAAEAQVYSVSSVTVTSSLPSTTIGSSLSSVLSSALATTLTTVTSVVNTVTTVAEVAVTGTPDHSDDDGSTATVDDGGDVTEVSGIVAVGEFPTDDDNPSTEPCCGGPITPVTTLALTTTTLGDNPFTLPCCTLPGVTVTTPTVVTPIIIPPIIVHPIVDFCPNIDGIQNAVPGSMTTNGAGDCVPPIPQTVACTLTASASAILAGQNATLTWTTDNATSFALNQGIGAVTPIVGGTQVVAPTVTTTYNGVAQGPGGPVTCSVTIVVTHIPSAPLCTLTASSNSVAPSTPVTLTYTTDNVTFASINNGVGNVTPVAGGTRTVTVNADTTYVLTAHGTNGTTVTCSAPVNVTTIPAAPACTLSASATSVAPGTLVTLAWTGNNLATASINNSVGNVTPVAGGTRTVTVNADTTYIFTGVGTNGTTVTCSAPVTVTTIVIPPAPSCTLSVSDSSVTSGTPVTLAWTGSNLASASINNGVGSVTPLTGGTRTVTVNSNTTYTFTGVGTNGSIVTCSAPVTVTVVNAPACTLGASANTVVAGTPVTLTWTSTHVASALLDGATATPVAGGTRTVTVNANTTYTYTGIGTNGSTVTCTTAVVVTPPPPLCTLSASASSVAPGTAVTLTYGTTNVVTASIDQGVGTLSPVTTGTKTVTVNANTTYTLTGTSASGVPVTCAAPVTITTGGGGSSPMCTLSASPTSINNGGQTTLTWGGTNILSVLIDNGVGAVPGASGSQSVTVNGVGTHTYKGTFTTTTGTTLTCTADVVVQGGGGGCTSNCGHSGGGGPRVLLSSLKQPGDQPLAFVYLSQIPYTGVELGPWGTALYWIVLILWSLAAAYLLFFTAGPFAIRKIGTFGSNVREMLRQPVPVRVVAAHVAPVAHAAPHAAPVRTSAHAPAAHASAHGHTASVEAPKGYQAHEGFRSYASGTVLTIDDLVKGLAREAEARPSASAHTLPTDFLVSEAPAHVEATHEIHEEVVVAPASVVARPQIAAPAPMHAPVAFNDDVLSFIGALLAGDKDTVFGTIRAITRSGGDSEAFLTHAVCALDDAYRARVDGSACHPEILAATADCHHSFLERMVTALTTAVDGSYSVGVTGVKLALTRALSIAQG